MPLDYGALLYDPKYLAFGVPATLAGVSITVIDDTRPSVTPAATGEVRSVAPGAYARIPELTAKGIARETYIDATLAFNGRTWTVRSYELQGDLNGEDLGEVRFLLKAVDAG